MAMGSTEEQCWWDGQTGRFIQTAQCRLDLRQYVIVMRGRITTQESLALDLDIMVKVGYQLKE